MPDAGASTTGVSERGFHIAFMQMVNDSVSDAAIKRFINKSDIDDVANLVIVITA